MESVAGLSHQAAPASPNLPRHLTAFIGRDAELRALRSLVAESRLVTVTGTGGAGKTRLAAEMTRSGGERWPDGTWWIELAGSDDVAGTVIANAGLPGRGRPIDVVTSWLEARRALLVLDNCEHLVEASAEFCQAVLERCPHVTILATSREPLGVPGEARWPLAALSEAAAMQLFESRARLVRPDFNAKTNPDTVGRICSRLDRLPLAIEMASSRLDIMSERELLANLDDRFRVLESGTRTGPERQQTMTAAIDWSYRLLKEEEARLFRRLAVFQGGFTMEAAQSVCSEPGSGGSILPVLARLVQKSMVVVDRAGDATRYGLLESHHDFARRQLDESGELMAVERRHFEFFKTHRWEPRESANFWAALAWAKAHVADGGVDLGLQVADAGYSDPARARSLLLDLLSRQAVTGRERARALNLAARLAMRQADHRESCKLADESIAYARTLDDPGLVAEMLSGAGVVYHAASDLTRARSLYDEALTLIKGVGERRVAIEVQNQVAVLATEQGHYSDALAMLEECLSFSRSEQDDAATAKYLESLANAELGLGRVDSAASHWRTALKTFRDLHDPFGAIWSIGGLALVASRRSDHAKALRLAAVVERMSREWSLSAWSARVTQLESAREHARKLLGPGKADASWNEGLAMEEGQALAHALDEDRPEALPADAGPLSRREREVVAMVAAGWTNKQIAQRLFIAERTAEGHVERIRNKLGVRSRTEVATWAVTHGVVPRDLDKF